MQLHPSNIIDPESPFFDLQRAFDGVLRRWRGRDRRRLPSAVTLSLAPQSTITLEGGEIELLDDAGTLWVTRECAPDLMLTAGDQARVSACGRTVVQALTRARVRIAEAA